MIKKARDLTGKELDYAVAVALGKTPDFADFNNSKYSMVQYSSDWRDGGAIIEREKISLEFCPRTNEVSAMIQYEDDATGNVWQKAQCWGSNPLEAAMRCFVISKLGEEVEVPG